MANIHDGTDLFLSEKIKKKQNSCEHSWYTRANDDIYCTKCECKKVGSDYISEHEQATTDLNKNLSDADDLISECIANTFVFIMSIIVISAIAFACYGIYRLFIK